MELNRALDNIRGVVAAYRGTLDEHQVLQASVKAIEDALHDSEGTDQEAS